MKSLLALAKGIDLLNEKIERLAVWAVFASCMVSATNAFVRYLLDMSSNAWLELQWYLFAVTVMLGTSYVLKINGHVRVDLIYGRQTGNHKAMIDLFGMILFVLPVSVLMTWLSWPWFIDAYVSGEVSSNAGGLLRWPVKLLVPVGFALLSLQAVSEIIKRIAFLRGLFEMETHYERPLQ